MKCLFATDLHGRRSRFDKLFAAVRTDSPDALFLGGDLLPPGFGHAGGDDTVEGDVIADLLVPRLRRLRERLGPRYPDVFVIPGNDDAAACQDDLAQAGSDGLLHAIHGSGRPLGPWQVYGYACVPPTPFLLKDWERYDVSRFVDPGCVSPEEGHLTRPLDLRYATIQGDLDRLAGAAPMGSAMFLFHAPPYHTALDRAALDGRSVDHVPLDVHVGSIAIRRFIEARQPLLTLHGHIHESARLTGAWRERIGRTWAFGAAHDGPELALVRFDPDRLDAATRELV